MAETENNVGSVEKTPAAAPKKSKAKKIFSIIGCVLAVIAVILLLILWQIDRIVATGTRTAGSMLTGTRVDIRNVMIRPFAGLVILQDFTVNNPEGFHNPQAIKLGKLHIDVDMGSLLSDKIAVDYVEVSGVAIDMEYVLGKGSNLDVILKNVEKASGADKKAAEKKKSEDKAEKKSDDKAAKKQVVIRKLILRDSQVTISSGVTHTSMVIPLIPIEMENVGEGKDIAGTISEVLSRIILEIGKVVNFDKIGQSLSDAGAGIADGVGKAADATGKTLNNTLDESVKLIKKLPGLGK